MTLEQHAKQANDSRRLKESDDADRTGCSLDGCESLASTDFAETVHSGVVVTESLKARVHAIRGDCSKIKSQNEKSSVGFSTAAPSLPELN